MACEPTINIFGLTNDRVLIVCSKNKILLLPQGTIKNHNIYNKEYNRKYNIARVIWALHNNLLTAI